VYATEGRGVKRSPMFADHKYVGADPSTFFRTPDVIVIHAKEPGELNGRKAGEN